MKHIKAQLAMSKLQYVILVAKSEFEMAEQWTQTDRQTDSQWSTIACRVDLSMENVISITWNASGSQTCVFGSIIAYSKTHQNQKANIIIELLITRIGTVGAHCVWVKFELSVGIQ